MAELRVPDDLRELDRWVLWRYERRDGAMTKVPVQVCGNNASPTNPATWSSFDAAVARWRQVPSSYSGLGFVFKAGDRLAGIDLDDCLDAGGELKSWAQGIIYDFWGTYMEISPSGYGVKIFARGDLPRKEGLNVRGDNGGIEIYSCGRFFTVTGRVFRGAPLEVSDHQKNLRKLYLRMAAERTGGKEGKPVHSPRLTKGGRNNRLRDIAGLLVYRAVCLDAIKACLYAMNAKQCEEPLPDLEIERILKSAAEWERRRENRR